ncbi:MAG: cell surface protein SprA [Bacteroidetes bacterium]|nr:MAG: cell surface protein SprA [Bacteroidota bacterium]
MTRKNILLATTGLFSLVTLFAFTNPKRVELAREQVLTLLFPDEELPIAPEYAEKVPGLSDLEKISGPVPGLLDTFPPLEERYDDFVNGQSQNPFDLKDPSAIQQEVEYDPVTNMYIITEKIGDDYYRAPTYMTFNEYVKWREKKQQQEYFDLLQGASTGDKNLNAGASDPIAKFDVQTSLIDRLFGGTNVDIKPQGNINLTFGFDYQKIQNPILTLRQQRTGNFDFDMDINMSAAGQIGEKLKLNFNYNTQATFDFDNQMKLNYDTKNFSEDEIIQNIEAGNVSLPLRSNLIRGAQNLFGFKTTMKFGHLNMTLLAAQQRSRQNSLSVQGGSQLQVYDKPIDEYDENRHFLLSHWNREQFEPALKCLPVPQSLFTITRMEVWITNDKLATQNVRDIVALMDLGEPQPYLDGSTPDRPDYSLLVPPAQDIKGAGLPANQNNQLYPMIASEITMDSTLRFSDKVVGKLKNEYNLQQIRDFEKVRARLLSPSEYSYDEQLGFLSINLNVQPDQVVGVAMEYTYNGIPHKVGEFTSEIPNGDTLNQNVLFVKMLKSTTANVRYPIWDLMMKNVYSVGSVNVDPQEFRFDIYYEDPGKGQKRFLNSPDIPDGVANIPLLQLFRLDTLNLQGDPGPDGIFDFVPGLTINLRNGRIMFPVLEPFGSYLEGKLTAAGASQDVLDKYVYPQLYDSTLFRAREFQQLNRFTLKGSFKSSTSSEISLGTFNLPQGSVRVSAGGRQLIEGQDYIVDYNIGKVKILNDAILQAGQNVNVSFEDNTLFGFQSRTMLGARFDYTLRNDINIGATFMNLFERPLTQKVNFGDDPINNKMYGLDFSISKEAPWLTKLVDKIPLIDTKEPSSITAQAEVAWLDPGHNRAINQSGEKGGIVYIDDFEGSTANLPLANPANSWVLASVPQGDDVLFPEAELSDSLPLGVNRSRLSWYIADPSARDGVDANNPYTRLIQFQDIFPNRQLTPLEQSALRPLDVTIFPRERGPYNYEIPDGYPGISSGLTTSGELDEPSTRWAGFMRGLNTNDFEAANIEFIEFWMLNPYMDKGDGTDISSDGSMYIDLGNISEDIMRDSRQFFENALPTGQGSGITANTRWGRVPVLPPVVNAFDNDPAKRSLQDLGLDGLDDQQEKDFFADWLNVIMASSLSPNAKAAIEEDPSNDNFVYFRDPAFDATTPGLLERYRRFNSPQGNSPVNQTQNLNPSATNYPDAEDLNRDNSLNETEAYFRYKLELKKRNIVFNDGVQMDVLDVDAPELRDLITDTVVFDRNGARFVWYRFKLPLDFNRRQTIGGIQDFRSIRFIRMFWKGFDERTTFRFATLELGRNQWRRFTQVLPRLDDPSGIPCDAGPSQIPFDVNAVSIEENAARTPFNYTIPYGISREQSVGAFPDILQNEQALSMSICSLARCDARAIFKTLNMDLRQFERMKMFVHAERVAEQIDSTDLTIFIRLGSDFYRNYYEYEIPLTPSDPDNVINGNPDSRSYKEEVWRPENNFDFPLSLLTDVKKLRNGDPNWNLEIPFVIDDPDNPRNKVKVVGNPNLGYVKGAMVGVRNVDDIDQVEHCVEVWINELRLNGFNEQGGYAGQARVDLKLADLGNVSIAGNYTSIGWGSIEQKLIQRQREEIIQYDLSTNLELGRFFPEKFGLRIPFYAQYSNTTKNPEYDPYDLDIKLKDKLNDEADPTKRDSIRTVAQDVVVNKGYNFTNVRKDRVGGARKIPLPWNIENFSLTYAFNQEKRRNPFIINDEINRYKGAIDYQYATGLKPLQPFKKLIKNDKYFKWITEMNFNPLPSTYGFSSNLERIVQVTTYRFAGEDPALNTYYNRRFTWDRNYDLGWEITKNLRFNFDATARSLIDEPQQYMNGEIVTDQMRRDSIWRNFKKLGRPKSYVHNASLNYNVPFKVIPFMDWITVKASYTAGYTWTAQSLKLQYLPDVPAQYADVVNMRSLGNVIQNNSARQINGDLNFEQLYNKSKYLAKINKKGGGGNDRNSRSRNNNRNNQRSQGDGLNPGGGMNPAGGGGDQGGLGGGDAPRSGRNNNRNAGNNRNNNPVSNDPSGNAPSGMGAGDDGNAPGGGMKDRKSKKEKNKDREPSMAERIALRPLMLVRKARFTYSENFSSVIPGFTPDTKLMGLSEGFSAPGWAFVAGLQPDTKWLDDAAAQGWITHRPELNQQVVLNYTQNIDAAVTLEPFTDFRIELSANRQYTKNNTELFKDQDFLLDPNAVDFQHRASRDLGSFTVSYFTMKTMFNNDINGLFDRYEDYRPIISDRLAQQAGNLDQHDKDGPGYRYGYGKIQQEVLIPAFISAYAEKDPNAINLNVFDTRPAINWRLNYNGLSKVGNLNKIFASVQITHGYKNTLTVNSYNTDIFFDQTAPYTLDSLNFNYVARYEIPQVVINEQFSPLLGVDIKLKNDMTFKVDFKKSRTLAMSFIDYQLAETQSSGYTIGFGYRLKNVNIPFLTGKKKKKSRSSRSNTGNAPPTPGGRGGQQANDMNFKFDFDLRDDITINHRLDQLDEAVPTRGARTISINPSVDYALNRRLKLRLFTDYRKTVPKTSQSFPITTVNAGVAVQFSLN